MTMLLARVIGTVVCPRKDPRLDSVTLKLVQIAAAGLNVREEHYVAADTLGAAVGQLVFTSSGASARRVGSLDGVPVDLAIVGVVERISGDPSVAYEE